MQGDFDRNFPSLDIQILGVNERGHEVANGSVINGRDIPWLQDIDSNNDGISDVWYNLWNIEYRDVVILDEANEVVGVYNLTINNLAETPKYNELRDMMASAAASPPTSAWQHPIEPLDVNDDQNLGPLDAVVVINNLGIYPGGVLPTLGQGQSPDFYLDPTGDGVIAPLDAVVVINALPSTSSAQAAPRASLSSAAVVPDTLTDTTAADVSADPGDDTVVVVGAATIERRDAAGTATGRPLWELVSPVSAKMSGDGDVTDKSRPQTWRTAVYRQDTLVRRAPMAGDPLRPIDEAFTHWKDASPKWRDMSW